MYEKRHKTATKKPRKAGALKLLPITHGTDKNVGRVMDWVNKLAKDGEIKAIAIAVFHKDGCASANMATNGVRWALIGAVETLKLALQDVMLDTP